jgi:predicted amidohydrolase YtcJ
MFLEDRIGSLEEGKFADLIVADTDVLTCPEDQIGKTRVLRNYVGGKLVYEKK